VPVVVTTPAVEPAVIPSAITTPTQVLTLSSSAKTISIGQAVTLIASIDPGAAAQVTIEARRAGTTQWSAVATATTSTTGKATWATTPLTTTEYRAISADGTSASGIVKVNVRARATVKTSARTVRKNSTVTVSGTIVTEANGMMAAAVASESRSRVVLQRKSGKKWVKVRTLTADSSGHFKTRIRPSKRGTRQYRIYVTGSMGNLGAASNVVKIRVK
jgi:5-hydroxyisourate hydrolase-like protein (transthyretin family)